jgi:hypothetical protein
MQAPTDWHGLIWADQNDLSGLIRHAKNKDLRHKFANLAGGEVHDGKHLFAHQNARLVMRTDLGRGLFFSDLIPEIDPKLYGWLASLWIKLSPQHSANTDIDLQEVVK